jgi:hypothetical protein
VPSLGRFASADTLVPDPTNPQAYNRYSYVVNNPLKYIDPTGHCHNNYEEGSNDLSYCLHLVSQLEAERYAPLMGENREAILENWLQNADIDALKAIMAFYDDQIETVRPEGASGTRSADRYNVCQYWQECYDPPTEYVALTLNAQGVDATLLRDQWGNIYFNLHSAFFWGASITTGSVELDNADLESLTVEQQEIAAQDALTGFGSTACASGAFTGCYGRSEGNQLFEGGLSFPPFGFDINTGYTQLIYDK